MIDLTKRGVQRRFLSDRNGDETHRAVKNAVAYGCANTSSEPRQAALISLAAAPAALCPLARYVPAMTNVWGVVLDSAAVRLAAAEGVPEVVITPICLLHQTSIDEML